MKAVEWKRLTTGLLAEGWCWTGCLAFRCPTRWVAHGLLAETSASDPGRFYLWVVRLPLYVPQEVVSLSWSDRFGASSRTFQPSEAETLDAIRGAAGLVVNEEEERSVVVEPPGGADNVRMQEARGYGLLLEGNAGGAVEVLARVVQYSATYPWEKAIVARAHEMREAILDGREAQAVEQLEAWRTQTMTALRLAKS